MEYKTLSETVKPENYNSPVSVQTVVSGKSLAPYGIPRTVLVQCSSSGEKKHDCKYENLTTLIIEPEDENILKFIDSSDSHFPNIIKKLFSIRCPNFSFVVQEIQNVERIYIAEMIGQDKTKDNTIKTAFYMGHGIEINTPYLLNGYMTVDPKDQSITYVFTQAKKVKTDVESFSIREHGSELRAFQKNTTNEFTLMNRLQALYQTYSRNITQIHYRFDLHLAVDLVFHSVLQLNFGSEFIKKGWLDIIVLGDTQCGKGYVAQGLSDYFGFGEVINAENATFAGLVAGMQQFNKHWVVTWGKLPMNDRGLVIIDEAGNLKEDWGRLSRIRSEGVAEITKIHTQVTNSRTRIIWLSNPTNKIISNFSYGVQALYDIISAPEDIARFDYCLVVAHEEVNMEEINQRKTGISWKYEQQQERNLIRWIWSRKPEQIQFTDEAIEEVYRIAVGMSKMFHFSIPLVQGENVRVKIAKIATAIAGRFFSTNKDGSCIVVRKVHVRAAWITLFGFYNKSSNGYLSYSKLKKTQEVRDDGLKKIENYIYSYKLQVDSIFNFLLNENTIDSRGLSEFLNQPPNIANEFLSMLIQYNCMHKRGPVYIKTPGFNKWLRKKVFNEKDVTDEVVE